MGNLTPPLDNPRSPPQKIRPRPQRTSIKLLPRRLRHLARPPQRQKPLRRRLMSPSPPLTPALGMPRLNLISKPQRLPTQTANRLRRNPIAHIRAPRGLRNTTKVGTISNPPQNAPTISVSNYRAHLTCPKVPIHTPDHSRGAQHPAYQSQPAIPGHKKPGTKNKGISARINKGGHQ